MQKAFIWGTGQIAQQVLQQFSVLEQYDVTGFIDNDVTKQSGSYWGKTVYAPSVLLNIKCDVLLVFADRYDEIYQQVRDLLTSEDKITILNYKIFYKQRLLRRYQNSQDPEIQEILRYINENDLDIFNYEFVHKYYEKSINVEYDEKYGMYYTWHCGKKLFFARKLDNEDKVRRYYRSLLLEQDIESPHRYLTENFDVQDGDVVIDAGVAEGNFSLEIIDRVSKIYLIESDEGWIEALKVTFRDYMNKVIFIPKYVTSYEEGIYTTIDSVIKEPVNFIKMDIEGNEWDALIGARSLLQKSDNLKCAICAYHSDFDEILIKNELLEQGLECSVSNGYMCFPFARRKTYVSTKLCRGIVRGIKGRDNI